MTESNTPAPQSDEDVTAEWVPLGPPDGGFKVTVTQGDKMIVLGFTRVQCHVLTALFCNTEGGLHVQE